MNHLTLGSFTFVCLSDYWKVSSVVPVFKKVGEWCTAKKYCPVSLLSLVSKVFEKHVNNRFVDHPEKCGLFYFCMVLDILHQLLIFWQLYLIELPVLLTDLGLGRLWGFSYEIVKQKKKTLNLLTLLSFVWPLSVFQIVGRSHQ